MNLFQEIKRKNNRPTRDLFSVVDLGIVSYRHTVHDPCLVSVGNAVEHNCHIMAQEGHTFCKRMLQ